MSQTCSCTVKAGISESTCLRLHYFCVSPSENCPFFWRPQQWLPISTIRGSAWKNATKGHAPLASGMRGARSPALAGVNESWHTGRRASPDQATLPNMETAPREPGLIAMTRVFRGAALPGGSGVAVGAARRGLHAGNSAQLPVAVVRDTRSAMTAVSVNAITGKIFTGLCRSAGIRFSLEYLHLQAQNQRLMNLGIHRLPVGKDIVLLTPTSSRG